MKKREIKFRVWNGIEMVYDVMVGKFGAFSFTTKYSETTPVMQSTGLKDKNGKEIYEGDILSVPEEYRHPDGRFITPGHYHVEYFIDGFGLYRKVGWWALSDFGIEVINNGISYVEIVGNIYGNKEIKI